MGDLLLLLCGMPCSTRRSETSQLFGWRLQAPRPARGACCGRGCVVRTRAKTGPLKRIVRASVCARDLGLEPSSPRWCCGDQPSDDASAMETNPELKRERSIVDTLYDGDSPPQIRQRTEATSSRTAAGTSTEKQDDVIASMMKDIERLKSQSLQTTQFLELANTIPW